MMSGYSFSLIHEDTENLAASFSTVSGLSGDEVAFTRDGKYHALNCIGDVYAIPLGEFFLMELNWPGRQSIEVARLQIASVHRVSSTSVRLLGYNHAPNLPGQMDILFDMLNNRAQHWSVYGGWRKYAWLRACCAYRNGFQIFRKRQKFMIETNRVMDYPSLFCFLGELCVGQYGYFGQDFDGLHDIMRDLRAHYLREGLPLRFEVDDLDSLSLTLATSFKQVEPQHIALEKDCFFFHKETLEILNERLRSVAAISVVEKAIQLKNYLIDDLKL